MTTQCVVGISLISLIKIEELIRRLKDVAEAKMIDGVRDILDGGSLEEYSGRLDLSLLDRRCHDIYGYNHGDSL